jgi:hypothetical protein
MNAEHFLNNELRYVVESLPVVSEVCMRASIRRNRSIWTSCAGLIERSADDLKKSFDGVLYSKN